MTTLTTILAILGYSFAAKVGDQIIKLTIWRGGTVIYNYDRGLDVAPKGLIDRLIVRSIISKLSKD